MRYCVSFGSPKPGTASEAVGGQGPYPDPFTKEGCDVAEKPAATHRPLCSAEVS